MTKIKGQNLRLMIDGKCVAAATSCSVHLTASLEDASTKDNTGDWQEQEATGKSWDMSVDALVVVDKTDTTGLQAFDITKLIGTTVEVTFQQTEGDQNRIAAANGTKFTGKAIVNDVSITAGNRQNATYTCQLTGNGELKQV